MKSFSYTQGDRFKRTGFDKSDAVLELVQTHKKDAHGKNVKLSEPLLHFGYSDKENKFTMYSSDADRMIHFERWKLILEHLKNT